MDVSLLNSVSWNKNKGPICLENSYNPVSFKLTFSYNQVLQGGYSTIFLFILLKMPNTFYRNKLKSYLFTKGLWF